MPFGAGISFISFSGRPRPQKRIKEFVRVFYYDNMNYKLLKLKLMNESNLLMEEQISRRKHVAIWLLGIGLIVSGISSLLFSFALPSLYESGIVKQISSYLWFQTAFGSVMYLLVIIGLFLIKGFENRCVSRWSKHWILAYSLLLVGDYLRGPLCMLIQSLIVDSPDSTMSNYAILVPDIIWFLLFVISPYIYMFWSIDSVRRNSLESTTLQGVRMIQSALALILLMDLIIYFSSKVTLYNLMSGTEISENGGSFAFLLFFIPQIVLFVGIKRLIHSPLFAPSEDLEGGHRQSSQKRFAIPLSVCGLVVAMVVCLGATWLLTVYWNELYYEIF